MRQENQAVPDLTLIYPGLAFHPPAEWPSRNQELNDGLRDLADRLRAGWDELQAQRRADGTHERFCGAANKGA